MIRHSTKYMQCSSYNVVKYPHKYIFPQRCPFLECTISLLHVVLPNKNEAHSSSFGSKNVQLLRLSWEQIIKIPKYQHATANNLKMHWTTNVTWRSSGHLTTLFCLHSYPAVRRNGKTIMNGVKILDGGKPSEGITRHSFARTVEIILIPWRKVFVELSGAADAILKLPIKQNIVYHTKEHIVFFHVFYSRENKKVMRKA